jgi:hypothetical protein
MTAKPIVYDRFIEFEGWKFPFTGREHPAGARLESFLEGKWLDLCYYDDGRDIWVYLSTLK